MQGAGRNLVSGAHVLLRSKTLIGIRAARGGSSLVQAVELGFGLQGGGSSLVQAVETGGERRMGRREGSSLSRLV